MIRFRENHIAYQDDIQCTKKRDLKIRIRSCTSDYYPKKQFPSVKGYIVVFSKSLEEWYVR